MDDMDLEALMAQLGAAQEVKSSARLSERNCVDLIGKLKELGLIGGEGNALLHTVTGREYITERKLQTEVEETVDRLGGRVSLADLPPILDMDYIHCEKAAHRLAAEDRGEGSAIRLIDGELLTNKYFDEIAVEINENLQQKGQVTTGELAKAYDLSPQLITSTLEARVGSAIDGALQSGLVYTPAYVARVRATVRGLLRGAAEPISLKTACARLRVHDVALTALIPEIVSALIAGSEVSGAYQKGSMIWTPDLYTKIQEEGAVSFYASNGYVEYETLAKLGIAKPASYLASRYPNDHPLETVFVSATMLHTIEAVADEALEGKDFCDFSEHLPSPFSPQDVQDLIKRSSKVKMVVDSGAGFIMAGTCFVTKAFLAECEHTIKGRVQERAKRLLDAQRAATAQGAAKPAPGGNGGGGGGRGRGGGGKQAVDNDDDSDDDWDMRPKKGKKGKKAKGGQGGKAKRGGGGGGGGGGGKGSAQVQGKASPMDASPPSRSEISTFILQGGVGGDDLEDAGTDGGLLLALANRMAAFAQREHAEAMKQSLKADAEERRVMNESLTRTIATRGNQMVMHARGLSAVEASPAVGGKDNKDSKEKKGNTKGGNKGGGSNRESKGGSNKGGKGGVGVGDEEDGEEARAKAAALAAAAGPVSKHLVKTFALPQLDAVLALSAIQAMNMGQDLGADTFALVKAAHDASTLGEGGGMGGMRERERVLLAKALPKQVKGRAEALCESIPKMAFGDACSSLEEAASELCGIRPPKVDKRTERQLLRDGAHELAALMHSDAAVTSTVAIAVPLLYNVKKKAVVSLPGKVLSSAVKGLEAFLEEDDFRTLEQLHTMTVSYIHAASKKDAPTDELAAKEAEIATLSQRMKECVAGMIKGEEKASGEE